MEAKAIDSFGELFRQLRTRRQLTDEQLALAAHRHRYYFRRWQTRRVPINRRLLLSVCKLLEVTDAERDKLLKSSDDRLVELSR